MKGAVKVKENKSRMELSKEKWKLLLVLSSRRTSSIYLSISSSTSILYLIIIIPYLPPLPFFSLIGNLFSSTSLPPSPLDLPSATCIYPSVTTPFLSSITSSLHVLFPRQKPCLIHSTPVSSLSYTLPPASSLPLPPLTLAFSSLQPCRRDETSVCTIH